MLRAIFHAAIMANYFFGLWYDQMYVELPHLKENKITLLRGRVLYLTMWNMLLQAIFFTVCLLNDVLGTNENLPRKTPMIRRFKDGLLTCLAFPLSMFVGLTFWGIYFVDRELVFPKVLDQFFPAWLNHVMHTNIMLFILIELATSFRKYPTKKFGLTVLGVFMVVYLVWIHVIHSYTGMWVYPILEVLSFPLRLVFFVALLGLACVLYVLGEKLNSAIWSKELRSLCIDSKKKK